VDIGAFPFIAAVAAVTVALAVLAVGAFIIAVAVFAGAAFRSAFRFAVRMPFREIDLCISS
jgi:hypothetical protein